MRLIADTNVIVRTLARDDPVQFGAAVRVLQEAEYVVLPIVALCEAVWVLRRHGRWSAPDIARALRTLCNDERAIVDRYLLEAGLHVLDAGGDFADGVIAAEGRRLGGSHFATFDREAAHLLEAQGEPVTLLG